MITLAELAEKFGGTVKGDGSCQIHALATLMDAHTGEIAFLANAKYRPHLETTNASAVIVSPINAQYCNTNALILDNPYLGFALIAQLLDTTPKSADNIAESAVVAADVAIGSNVAIGANAVIENGVVLEDNVTIGANCFIGKNAIIKSGTQLWSNVSIYHRVEIGKDCLIQANSVIGADGFGYANDKGRWVKIPQLGAVIIGDNVEIGASTTIDRGALENTIVEDNCIIDNQVQIAHNAYIGSGTAIAGCTVVAGSTTIGKNCTIGGLSAITGHVKIADGSMFTGMSMVTKGTKEAGLYSSGVPALPNKQWRRNASRYKHLDSMYKKINELEKALADLTPADKT